MAYLYSAWIADPNHSWVYKYTNNAIESKASTGGDPNGICVATNKTTVIITNRSDNTISIYNNGTRVKDLAVGKQPWGVCQGQSIDLGASTLMTFYVTNYADNTVSRIVTDINGENAYIDSEYNVGLGPRGVCSDKDGNIYVANYVDSTVTPILAGKRVSDNIEVALNPEGICSNASGEIFVACSTSGVVSKIRSLQKVRDYTVGSIPRCVAVDTNDNVWVTNFNSSSVAKINADGTINTYTVGTNPYGIAVDVNSNIWVLNYSDSSVDNSAVNGHITILNSSGTIIEDITTAQYNPCAFGDFTGMQAAINLANSSSISADGTRKIGWDDLTPELQNIINHLILPDTILAKYVTLEKHPGYSNVQEALDALLYEKPNILEFNVTPSICQTGSSQFTFECNWSIDSTYIASQVLTIDGVEIARIKPGINVFTIVLPEDKAIQDNKVITLNITDTSGATFTATAEVKFCDKIYWGASAMAALTKSEEIRNIGGSASQNDWITVTSDEKYTKAVSFNASGGKYLYIAVPSAYGFDEMKDFHVGQLHDSNWEVTREFEFLNESGYTTKYDIFRSGFMQTGANIEVSIVHEPSNYAG